MKRLTKRKGNAVFFSEDACALCAYNEQHHSTFCENLGCSSARDRTCPYLQVADRLAAYEDTGLTPEQVANLAKAVAELRINATEAEGASIRISNILKRMGIYSCRE
jgi:hypothetical protein